MTDVNGNPANHDHLGYSGAVDLAKRLRQYWRDRGHEITTSIETVTLGSRHVYSVRSNLVAGLPPIAAAPAVEMDEAA